MIPVAWLAEELAKESAVEPGERPALAVTVDLTVQQVAQRFNRGASTVRTWCEQQRFPNAYRLNGREWRIPAGDVTAFQIAAQTQQRPATAASTPNLSQWRQHLPHAS